MVVKSLFERLRTLLILGRISNLPTVWSNLLVGWILVGPRPSFLLLGWVLLGGSFLYIGGMYLNDFCDAAYDARYCRERPIPAGKISRRAVGILGVLWFIAGLSCFAVTGSPVTVATALLLLATIILYDFWHKNTAWSPLVMGLCRVLLYPLAASANLGQSMTLETFHRILDSTPPANDLPSFEGFVLAMTLSVIPVALPLGLYVAGITYLAKGESRPGRSARWALLLLVLPVAFSLSTYFNFPDRPTPFMAVALICLLQFFWMAWLLVPFWRNTEPSIGRVVSGLLAGIVLVDMIALVPLVGPLGVALFPLFVLALLLQRFVPAT
jgi:4-hydroxybenzoate polyprenyltransferase